MEHQVELPAHRDREASSGAGGQGSVEGGITPLGFGQLGAALAGRQLKSVVVAFNCVRYLEVGAVGVAVSEEAEGGHRSFEVRPLPRSVGMVSVVEDHWTGILSQLADSDVELEMLPHARFEGEGAWGALLGGLRDGFTPQHCGPLEWDFDEFADWGLASVHTTAFRDSAWRYCRVDETLSAAGLRWDPSTHEVDSVVFEDLDRWFLQIPYRLPRDQDDAGGVDTTSADAMYASQIVERFEGLASVEPGDRQQLLLILEFDDGEQIELHLRSMVESMAVADQLCAALGRTPSEPSSIDFEQIGPAIIWPTGDLGEPDPRLEQFRDEACGDAADELELKGGE